MGNKEAISLMNTDEHLNITFILTLKAKFVYEMGLKRYCLLATLFLEAMCTGTCVIFGKS